MLFITHDLALVAEVADYVVVMRDGEIREQGSVRKIFEAPRGRLYAGASRLPAALGRRPVALAGDRGFPGRTASARARAAPRTTRQTRRSFWKCGTLRRAFIPRGLFGRKEFKAVKDASFRLAQGKTLGVVGESGSGKTTLALDAGAPASGVRRRGAVRRTRICCRCRREAACRTSAGSRSSSRIPTLRSTRALPPARSCSSRCRSTASGRTKRERGALARELLEQGGPAAVLVLQVSSRIFRRPAAKDRDRPLPDDETRRADLR